MRPLTWTTLALLLIVPDVAAAATKTIPVVHSAQAAYSRTARHTIVVQASVDLPNSCWSNPRFQRPAAGVKPDAGGAVMLVVVADNAERPGLMCAMMYRPGVAVPPLRWTTYPKRLKAITVTGSQQAVTAPVTGEPR
ncbi:MAG TPA: hypothetical protein VKT30_05395 [Caulobacteraceae bacterium]|nr:hypothetical protein [Caulobacteraceae bacterium]